MRRAGIVTTLISMMITCAAVGGETQQSSLLAHKGEEKGSIHLTGNLRVDLFAREEFAVNLQIADQEESEAMPAHKSPWLAAGMSLVVPGAGEFYADNYWRAAAFFAIEVAAWTVAYAYDKKGDRQTDLFENYADAHWSAWDYAEDSERRFALTGQYNWRIPGTEGLPAWQRVDWNELNRMEREIGSTNSGRYYSHTLPHHGEQQYYELIGKYNQFNQGWQDIELSPGPDGNLNTYYEDERAKADDLYQVGSTMVSIVIVNHILSGIDAALCATSFNKVHASVGHKKMPDGPGYSLQPMLKFSYDL